MILERKKVRDIVFEFPSLLDEDSIIKYDFFFHISKEHHQGKLMILSHIRRIHGHESEIIIVMLSLFTFRESYEPRIDSRETSSVVILLLMAIES